MELKRYIDFLNENYHQGKEIIIRPASIEEVKKFCKNTYTSSKSDINILDSICFFPENVHGAFESNKMIGAITFKKSDIEDFISVDLIYIDPDNRKSEIGKLLIQYVEDETGNSKLITNPYTEEAESFFKKIGFKFDRNIDSNDDNTMIKENDNYKKSVNTMRRFGMMDYSELPISVKKAAEDSGLFYEEDWPGLDGYGTKNYTNYKDQNGNNIHDNIFDVVVGMNKNHDTNKFDEGSTISVYMSEDTSNVGVVLVVDQNEKPDLIIKFLNNLKDITLDLEKYLKQGDFNNNEIKNILNKYDIKGEGIIPF